MASQNKSKENEKKQELSALDAYLNRVFKLAILAPSIATATAAIYFTVLKAAGWYPNIPVWVLVIFALMDASFMVTSIWFMKTSFGEDGVLKSNKLRMGKLFTVIVIITYFGSKFLVEELEKYANYDTLTHLLNRRSMDNYLQEAYRQANTGRSSFCLLMADIDDFKKVNDTYGHDCGNEVLKYVA